MPTIWPMTAMPHGRRQSPAGTLLALVSFDGVELLDQAALDRRSARARIEHEGVERRLAACGRALAIWSTANSGSSANVDVVRLLERGRDDACDRPPPRCRDRSRPSPSRLAPGAAREAPRAAPSAPLPTRTRAVDRYCLVDICHALLLSDHALGKSVGRGCQAPARSRGGVPVSCSGAPARRASVP